MNKEKPKQLPNNYGPSFMTTDSCSDFTALCIHLLILSNKAPVPMARPGRRWTNISILHSSQNSGRRKRGTKMTMRTKMVRGQEDSYPLAYPGRALGDEDPLQFLEYCVKSASGFF